MAFFTGIINKVFGAVNGSGGGVLPILEKADGTGVNAQAGTSNGMLVEVVGADIQVDIDSSDLATEVTAAAILAKLIAAPATAALQTLLNGYVVPGTWYPLTQVAPADSGIIRGVACTARSVVASNRTASTVYMMLYDTAEVPADAVYPRVPFIAVPADSTIEIALGGLSLANGLCWSTTTTFGVKTIGATTPLVVSAELV
jgi:hypothetical protein